MEKPISQMNDPFGQESYVYKGNKIGVTDFFLYEINLHKYWKKGYCLLDNKLIKSNKLLKLKKSRKYKRFKDYIIEEEISLVAAPYKFIIEKSLPVYKIIIKPKKIKKK